MINKTHFRNFIFFGVAFTISGFKPTEVFADDILFDQVEEEHDHDHSHDPELFSEEGPR